MGRGKSKRSKLILGYSLRSACGFGAGGLFVVLMEWFLFFRNSGEILSFWYFFAGYFLSGAFGAYFFFQGLEEKFRAALGFGVGFMLTGFAVFFTTLSMQASAGPEYAWSAWGCGLGFALGGAIGGVFVSFRVALAAGLTFGIAGAVWGPLLFWHFWQRKGAALLSLVDVVAILVIIFPYVVGGALFGAVLGCMLEE